MARPIIAPRRGEAWFVSGGYPTVRFAEYVEASAEVVQEASDGIINDVDVSTQVADLEFIDHWRD